MTDDFCTLCQRFKPTGRAAGMILCFDCMLRFGLSESKRAVEEAPEGPICDCGTRMKLFETTIRTDGDVIWTYLCPKCYPEPFEDYPEGEL